MARSTRHTAEDSIIHGARGAQVTSSEFTSNVDKYGLRLSLRTVGDCHEAAMSEPFWARIQTELPGRKKWATIGEPSSEMPEHTDTPRKHKRRQSKLYIPTPTEYENLYAAINRPRGRSQKPGVSLTGAKTGAKSGPLGGSHTP